METSKGYPGPIEEMPEGYEFPSIQKTVSFEKMKQFSGGLGPSQHTDLGFAKQFGHPTALAQGLMSHLYVTEVLTRAFGQALLEGGKITSNFLKPVYAGDTLCIKGKLIRKRAGEGGTCLEIETRCENQRGELVTAGTATLFAGTKVSR